MGRVWGRYLVRCIGRDWVRGRDRTWGWDWVSSTAAKWRFWEMTPTGSITRYHLFFLIEDIMGYVESVVVEKLIWSRI